MYKINLWSLQNLLGWNNKCLLFTKGFLEAIRKALILKENRFFLARVSQAYSQTDFVNAAKCFNYHTSCFSVSEEKVPVIPQRKN
jgi:hypothetical protein